jgi:hypothetical protein
LICRQLAYIKDGAKLSAVLVETSQPPRNPSRKKWEIFLPDQEGNQNKRERNQAPPVRRRISAPVTVAGHKTRIVRRRYCLWCENGRVGEKEARRKIELSSIRSESSGSLVKRFHDFPAPRNGQKSFFSPAKKIQR